MKLANLIIRVAAGAALAAMLAGCATRTVNTVEPSAPGSDGRMVSFKKVVTDRSLDRKVNVAAVNALAAENGHLKVQVEVRNLTNKRQRFTYRVEWFDAHGMLIRQPQASAIARSLEGRETGYITIVAPTAEAKDYRLTFLEALN
ncbi:MAG: YcfL family protein [Verrucomicrobia bacterium]|jgi:uncharacterized protein YcfL|nr:YcfL family protein [Verrucomicrobiota bacterium]